MACRPLPSTHTDHCHHNACLATFTALPSCYSYFMKVFSLFLKNLLYFFLEIFLPLSFIPFFMILFLGAGVGDYFHHYILSFFRHFLSLKALRNASSLIAFQVDWPSIIGG